LARGSQSVQSPPFARPPDGLRSPAARCAKLAFAARRPTPSASLRGRSRALDGSRQVGRHLAPCARRKLAVRVLGDQGAKDPVRVVGALELGIALAELEQHARVEAEARILVEQRAIALRRGLVLAALEVEVRDALDVAGEPRLERAPEFLGGLRVA